MEQLIYLSDEICEALRCPKGTRMLVQKPEPIKKWEPPEWDWLVKGEGRIGNTAPSDIAPNRMVGNAFPTLVAAEQGRTERIVRERLAMRAQEIDPDWAADWGNFEKEKWFVAFNEESRTWLKDYTLYFNTPGLVYMSKETATQIRDELNSGFLKLEVKW